MIAEFITYVKNIFIQYEGLKYLLILLCFIYVVSIIRNFMALAKIVSCIGVLHDFIEAYGNSSVAASGKNRQRTSEELEALKKYPAMREFESFYSEDLSYSYSSTLNYNHSISLYNEFLMTRNSLIDRFKKSLNPLYAVKQLFLLPGNFLAFLGFNLKDTTKNLINFLHAIAGVIISLFSDEIKLFITNLLKLL